MYYEKTNENAVGKRDCDWNQELLKNSLKFQSWKDSQFIESVGQPDSALHIAGERDTLNIFQQNPQEYSFSIEKQDSLWNRVVNDEVASSRNECHTFWPPETAALWTVQSGYQFSHFQTIYFWKAAWTPFWILPSFWILFEIVFI